LTANPNLAISLFPVAGYTARWIGCRSTPMLCQPNIGADVY
jgi:hypothetical protein